MRITRSLAFLSLAMALGGCAALGIGGGDDTPKTPVIGNRMPVLTSESGVEVDPSIADVAVTLPPDTVNTAWPQPGGAASKAVGPLALGTQYAPAWSASIAGNTLSTRLAAAPVIDSGRLYVMDTNAQLRAFDAATGALVWQVELEAAAGARASRFGGGVSADGPRIYATNGVGDVAAIDAATGNIVWKVKPGGPLRGSPTIAFGAVFVMSQDNQIFALRIADGNLEWSAAATLETSGVFGVAAPAAGQGTIVAGFSSGELNAYRYENGLQVWGDALSRTSISTAVAALSDIDADPIIDRGRVYALGQGGRMVSLELTTGQRLWEINVAGISTPTLAGEWLFVVTDDAQLLCIARVNGKIRWKSQLPRYRVEEKKKDPITWSGPVLGGGRLILTNSLGELVEVSPADGAIIRQFDAGAAFFLPPVIANQTLYTLDSKGKITAWR